MFDTTEPRLAATLRAIDAASDEPLVILGAKYYWQLRSVELFAQPTEQEFLTFARDLKQSGMSEVEIQQALASIAGRRARLELVLRTSELSVPIKLVEGEDYRWTRLRDDTLVEPPAHEDYVRKIFYNINLGDKPDDIIVSLRSHIMACFAKAPTEARAMTAEGIATGASVAAGSLLLGCGLIDGLWNTFPDVGANWLLSLGAGLLALPSASAAISRARN